MKVENKPDSIVTQDTKEKRVQYIQRNNELTQELSYAHSTSKKKINSIYNSHFTGSVLWDLIVLCPQYNKNKDQFHLQ